MTYSIESEDTRGRVGQAVRGQIDVTWNDIVCIIVLNDFQCWRSLLGHCCKAVAYSDNETRQEHIFDHARG